jgi:hypothetical protein
MRSRQARQRRFLRAEQPDAESLSAKSLSEPRGSRSLLRFLDKCLPGLRALEHDPEKWMPVFRKDHAPKKKLDHDPIQFDRIMV